MILMLDSRRLQPYRLLSRSERETRERGFLTSSGLEKHLVLIENAPEELVRLKIREMEENKGPVTLEYPRRGSLKFWS